MYLGNNQFYLNEYHLRQLLCEAKQERLARLARENGSHSAPLYAPLLAQLGRQLSHLGHSLQEHYEASGSLAVETES